MAFPQQLIDGYRAFLIGRLRHEQDRYRGLAESGQSPQIMVIGCCDSRVSPEVIFDARPGELFVVRNVANIVPPFAPDGRAHGVSAALEFGVGALKVRHIVVLGHAQCGGVKAFAEDAEPISPGDFIGNWMKLMSPAADRLGPRGTLIARRISDAARAGQRRQQHRQSDDVSAPAHPDRTWTGPDPWRVFWRRDRPAFGARPGDGAVRADRNRRSCTDVRAAPLLTAYLRDQMA